ncbi:MAG: hypothetical protein ISQ13_05040 [Candidatus Margulisbacteria bacterium]|nr:hypothetical protein [Candidatus Margulisiibacteriota bacterium]
MQTLGACPIRMVVVAIFASLSANAAIMDPIELMPYNQHSVPHKPHVIVLVAHLSPPSYGPVMRRLIKKIDPQPVNKSYQELSMHLFKQGYQLMAFSYRHPNEWIGPGKNHHHMLFQYSIRKNKLQLTMERTIIANAFESLDHYVGTQRAWRPMAIVLHLPPEPMHTLHQHTNKLPSFSSRRDFSLANTYHQLHKRRYIHPFVLVVYDSLHDHHAQVFDEYRQRRPPLL